MKHIRKLIRSLKLQVVVGLILLTFGAFMAINFGGDTPIPQVSATKPQPAAEVIKNNQPVQTDQALISGTPVHISIPDVAIDLNVIPGYYYPATDSWTLSLTDAQYAVMTAKANNKEGDTFIYAHARKGLFYSLPQVKPGDTAIITTDNGHTFTYTFTSSTVTSPQDTSLFKYQGKPILILQTCSGLWYQNRQLFVFDLTKAS